VKLEGLEKVGAIDEHVLAEFSFSFLHNTTSIGAHTPRDRPSSIPIRHGGQQQQYSSSNGHDFSQHAPRNGR
jgi:hypothetical protein